MNHSIYRKHFFLLALLLWTAVPAIRLHAADTISNPWVSDKNVATWDCIYFGNYYQGSSNAKEPIKWRVLSVNGNDAFLLADQNLDCYPYCHWEDSVTWETSSIRTWLNDSFFNAAFNSNEKSAIKLSNVINEDYKDTDGGNNTQDRIFLLSMSEAENEKYGFVNDLSRGGINTEYTKGRGAYTYHYNPRIVWSVSSESKLYDENGYWWLRSPGWNSQKAAVIDYDGSIVISEAANDNNNTVRPCLHLNIASAVWSYAGTVSSDRTFTCAEHTWDDGEITKEATVEEEGEKTYTCTVCGTKSVEFLPKLTIVSEEEPGETSKEGTLKEDTPKEEPAKGDTPKEDASKEDASKKTGTTKPAAAVKKGSVLKNSSASYKVLAGLKTVTYTAPVKKTSAKVTIPATVKFKGTVY